MYLVAIVIAVCCLQFWGANNPFHRDEWFHRFIAFLKSNNLLNRSAIIGILAVVGVPTLFTLALDLWIIEHIGWFVSILFSSVVLFYCLGRGEFSEYIYLYTQACSAEDWDTAYKKAESLGVPVNEITTGDWSNLHEATLQYASYRGFERLFAVLFWFALFGPAGAICYRLSHLYATDSDPEVNHELENRHWLWVLEWPAARILGLSFAMTGNFVGCLHHWKAYCYCLKNDTSYVLKQFVLGALSVDEALVQNCEVSRREMELLQSLYTRTLWFWLGALALMTLF